MLLPAEVFGRSLQEIAEHGEIHGFAEAPGAGKKQDLLRGFEEFDNKIRFIDEARVLLAELPEIADAQGGAEGHGVGRGRPMVWSCQLNC